MNLASNELNFSFKFYLFAWKIMREVNKTLYIKYYYVEDIFNGSLDYYTQLKLSNLISWCLSTSIAILWWTNEREKAKRLIEIISPNNRK